jgi:hypothetical protein
LKGLNLLTNKQNWEEMHGLDDIDEHVPYHSVRKQQDELIPVEDAPITLAFLDAIVVPAVSAIGAFFRTTLLADATVTATFTIYDGDGNALMHGEVNEEQE